MKKNIFAVASSALITIGVIGMAATGLNAAHAQSEPKGVFVSGIQPGIITAISGNQITIKNIDDEVIDIIVEPHARFDREGKPITFSDVKVGNTLGAAGWLDGKTLRAVGVTVLTDADGKEMQQLLNKHSTHGVIVGTNFVLGNVTAIDGNKLTVKRTDAVVQVIEVDGRTTVQTRGRDGMTSATLADVKVGTMFSAVGGLKNKVFLAKTVYLIATQ